MNKANVLKLAFLLCAAACSVGTGTLLAFLGAEGPSNVSQRTLTFAERVAYQSAIEDVYWRHRIWPDTNPAPKPPLDKVMSQAQIEKKVEDYLRNSQALEDYWLRPITPDQLQAEMERMASHTKQPEVLQELFEALGNDPFVIAECLARPVLAERLANGDPVTAGVVATPLRGVARNVPPARGYSANYFTTVANSAALGTSSHCRSSSPLRPKTNTRKADESGCRPSCDVAVPSKSATAKMSRRASRASFFASYRG